MPSENGNGRGPRAAPPLVVELVGTPGAGKTALSFELVRQLRGLGFDAATILEAARPHAARTVLGRAVARVAPRSWRRPLLWELFYVLGALEAVAFALERRRLARLVLRGQFRRPISRSMKRHTLFWFFQLAGRHRFLTSTSIGREALVLDDGFLHRAVALHASHLEEPDAASVAAYVDLVPRPDAVVHVVSPREVCERRVRERGVWRHSRHLSEPELSRYLDHAGRAVETAVGRARELGWTVLPVDNGDRPLERSALDLAEALANVAELAGDRRSVVELR